MQRGTFMLPQSFSILLCTACLLNCTADLLTDAVSVKMLYSALFTTAQWCTMNVDVELLPPMDATQV